MKVLEIIYTQKMQIADLYKKLAKAEHDRDRYKARIAELNKIIKNGGIKNDKQRETTKL